MRTVATGVHQRSYLDTWIARVVALGVALVMFALIFVTFGEAIGGAIGVRNERAGTSAAAPVDPRVRNCIEQRYADIERDRAGGVLNDRQVAGFRSRVAELCRAQLSR